MISTTQVSVAGTAATLLGIVPPGPASVVVTNGGDGDPVCGGRDTQPGTLPLTAVVCRSGRGGRALGQFSTSAGTQLWGQASSGTITAGLIISTGLTAVGSSGVSAPQLCGA